MNIVAGNVVRGEDFFDREDLISDIWQTLQSNSILMAAPRRVGKTSLMQRLYDKPEAGFRVVYLDGQDYAGPDDLVADLMIKVGELHQDIGYLFRRKAARAVQHMEEVEIWKLKLRFQQEYVGRWREQGERAILDAIHDDSNLLIILDELPLMLHRMMRRDGPDGPATALELLDWLRHIRTDPRLNKSVRQLIGGSVGLPRIASALGGSAKVNDLTPVPVAPFTKEQARELVTHLLASRGLKIDDATMIAFLDQVGTFIPIFVQIMASALAAEARNRGVAPTPDLVHECYQKRAMGPEYRITFEDYYERLRRYYDPSEARAAESILRQLALSEHSLGKPALLDVFRRELGPDADPSRLDLLLAWLSDDFYIEELPGGMVVFQSRWVRDWWRRYHATG